MTEFGLTVKGDESKTVSGKIGSGGAKITLVTDVGDVTSREARPSRPLRTPRPPRPKLQLRRTAPHRKPSKALPAQPVTQ